MFFFAQNPSVFELLLHLILYRIITNKKQQSFFFVEGRILIYVYGKKQILTNDRVRESEHLIEKKTLPLDVIKSQALLIM